MYSTTSPAHRERKYADHLKIVAAKKEAATPVSCAMSPEMRGKLNILARSLGVRVADLLGTALEITFGEDLAEIKAFTEIFSASINPCADEKSVNSTNGANQGSAE